MNPFRELFDHLEANAPTIARTTAEERVERIRRLYQAVYERRAAIGAAGRAEVNSDGRGQLIALKGEVDHTTSHVAEWMARRQVEDSPSLMGRTAYVHQEPKGVVLHLATWNAPFLISLQPVVSMIAAGNTVVLKPSEVAPVAADLIVEIVGGAGLADQVAVVTGGPEVAQQLLDLPFDHICYVGNNRVGRLVMEAAAKTFAGITLEMGGKNPVVVDAEADLADAARRIVDARHIIGGQACLCPDYVLVQEEVKDAFTHELVNAVTAFYDPHGNGFAATPDLPRIINERHVDRIKGLLDDAIAKGAKAVVGGTATVADRFVEPTVLDCVTPEMEIFTEEIFGPILTVHGFATREDAVREIGKRPKPLGLYIFTSNSDTAEWYLANTRAGSTAINAAVVQATVPTLPFGGVNHSGTGRLGGKAGFLEFSNPRGVVVDSLDAAERVQQSFAPRPAGLVDHIDGLLAPSLVPTTTGGSR